VNFPTAEQVLPVLDDWVDPLYESLRHGIDYADSLQPDEQEREPWYWSHASRGGDGAY
jgi:hypothetical protein